MVTDALLAWLVGAATWLVSLVPESRLELGDVAAAWSHVGDLNWFLPIVELQALVLAVMLLGPALLLATLTSWLFLGVLRGGESRS